MSHPLEEFLKCDKRSRICEDIYKHKLIFDLKLSAAAVGMELHCFEPDVDQDGFDLIFANTEMLLPIQTKTVIGKTSAWRVHKSMLRPSENTSHRLHNLPTKFLNGSEGGVVLIDLRGDMEQPCYYYSDIYVLTALHSGVRIKGSMSNRKKLDAAINLLFAKGKYYKLTRSYFVRAAEPSDLLRLMGFSSSWRDEMFRLLELEENEAEAGCLREELSKELTFPT